MLQEIEPRSFHIEYKKQMPKEGDILLCCQEEAVLAGLTEQGECILPTVGEVLQMGTVSDTENMGYLFAIDEIRFFCLLGETVPEYGRYSYRQIRTLRTALPGWMVFAACTGFRLWTWYANHHFCGRCGGKMVHHEKERAMYCQVCHSVVYPEIAPSVIVAVKNKNKLLLTKYQASHSPYRHYSLIAGYVETGETAEDTVRREVMEEVGLKVKNIRYYKSQPWPFSGALLLGYFCDLDGDDKITREEQELEEAIWVEREQLEERSNDISLTGEMMEQFRLNR